MAKASAPGGEALAALQGKIGWRFRDPNLLALALRHASALEGRKDRSSNERLEFLGDRVLNLIIAAHLFDAYREIDESLLALRFNALVNRSACARAARRIDLGAALELSQSEAQSGGRNKEAILADACEALIAALYLDGGLEAAQGFVMRIWAEELKQAPLVGGDPKSTLQEWAAVKRRNLRYDMIERDGPDHAPRFVIEAVVEGLAPTRGEGASKRDAERAAATEMLKQALKDD